MTKDLGAWTAEDCALMLIDCVAEAGKRAASAHGVH